MLDSCMIFCNLSALLFLGIGYNLICVWWYKLHNFVFIMWLNRNVWVLPMQRALADDIGDSPDLNILIVHICLPWLCFLLDLGSCICELNVPCSVSLCCLQSFEKIATSQNNNFSLKPVVTSQFLLSRGLNCSQSPVSMLLKTTAVLFLFSSTCELCRSAVGESTRL